MIIKSDMASKSADHEDCHEALCLCGRELLCVTADGFEHMGTQRKHREHTDQTNENQTTREADRQIER